MLFLYKTNDMSLTSHKYNHNCQYTANKKQLGSHRWIDSAIFSNLAKLPASAGMTLELIKGDLPTSKVTSF